MRGERAAGDGTGDHPRQIQHAQARQRTIARRAMASARLRRSSRSRAQAVRPAPWRAADADHSSMRAHHRHHAAAGIGRGLERLGVPLHQRGLNLVAFRLAVQHLADGVAVMPEIGMQPHEAPVAGFVNAGDRIPGRPRRLAVDAQIALAAAFDDGMAHVDRDILRLSAAQFPDLRGGKSGRGNAGLRRGGDAKRRRQLRLVTGQRDAVERGRLAAGGGPEVGENFAGRLHGRIRRLGLCSDFGTEQQHIGQHRECEAGLRLREQMRPACRASIPFRPATSRTRLCP